MSTTKQKKRTTLQELQMCISDMSIQVLIYLLETLGDPLVIFYQELEVELYLEGQFKQHHTY